jgi:putative flavoprotein involved in K+ transport
VDEWDVAVCGAGPAGLGSAALLRQAGLRVLVIERGDAVGASWRSRYEALRLNSLGWISRLPAGPTGWRFRHYPTRDEWIGYLERYAARHRLRIRFGVEALTLERAPGGWSLVTSDGTFRVRFAVVALGNDREPHVPAWPGRESFRGELLHAADYRDAESLRGRDVLIVGANTTGVELASLISRGGARRVRVAVRTPPNLFARDWHGFPLHPIALVLDLMPARIADALGRMGQRLMFGDLRRHGLGQPPLGVKSTVLRRRIGPAIDAGFIDYLKRGRVELLPAVTAFEGSDVVLDDGSRITPEVVIAATGYRRGLEHLVGHLGVLDHGGWPLVHASATARNAPGLHFVGYRSGVAGPLRQMRLDAEDAARAIGAEAGRAGRCAVRPPHPLLGYGAAIRHTV